MALERTIAYLLLGGNLGDIKANLKLALQLLEERVGKIVSVSALYETAAWGKTDQPAFLNQAVGVETDLAPMDVLAAALAIEAELGRIRKEKWGERLIDIDLILFGDQVINIEGKLQVPHPHMQDRNFVLTPLAEIAGDVVHPVWNKNISTLAENTSDKLPVKRL